MLAPKTAAMSGPKIPSEWKTAKIIPVHKCGPKTDVNNYRPISILPIVSKIMERAIQIQLLSFIKANKILCINQSGFRRNHSTESTVVFLADNILKCMDKQQFTGTVFIDLKKLRPSML